MDDSRIRDIFYKRANGEPIINDAEAIRSCKNEQSRDIIDNARLGSYDKFGNYVIIPDIRRELISMPKLVYNVKQENNNIVYEMKSSIPIFGDVFFRLTFSNSEAVLSLCETVKREANGYLETFNENIDSCVVGNGGLPKDIVFRNFNIKNDSDDFGKKFETYDYNNILTRKVYLSLLSKELNTISKVDEQLAYNKMIGTLKSSGEYGKRVLTNFVERLKDRPNVFEIDNTTKYNKAINEVLLSSLEVSTTQQDKEDFETKKAYLSVLNARNENIDKYLDEANSKVDTKYVEDVVKKATINFNAGLDTKQDNEEFFDSLKQTTPTKRTLDKPILKQGKEENKTENKEESKNLSKEDKIKAILNKDNKKKAKKTPGNKKLKPAKKAKKKTKLKGPKKKGKKLAKGKLKKKKKKLAKGKLKKKKKKLSNAKSPQKAKGKVGGKLKPPAPQKKKKAEDKLRITRLFVNKYFDRIEDQKQDFYKIPANEPERYEQTIKPIAKQANDNELNLGGNSFIKKTNFNDQKANPRTLNENQQNDLGTTQDSLKSENKTPVDTNIGTQKLDENLANANRIQLNSNVADIIKNTIAQQSEK